MPISDIAILGGFSLGLLLVIIFIADLILGRRISSAISVMFKKVPVVGKFMNPMVILIIIGAFAFLMGGFSLLGSKIGIGTGALLREKEPVAEQQCIIEAVEYSSIGANAGFDTANYTFTADASDKSNYYVDSSNSSSVVNATIEINGNWTVRLQDAPSTGEECVVKMYIVGPSFKDENSIGANANDIYDLLDTARSVSDLQGLQYGNRVSSIQFEQDAWCGENSAGDREKTALSFTAGELSTKLTYTLDLENTAYGHINKNSQFKIYFVQQIGSSPSSGDPVKATLTLRKGAIT